MKPIKPTLMPHIVTLYNVHKSPLDGKLEYYRSLLERVRIMDFSSAVNVGGVGWSRAVTSNLLVDPFTSIASFRDENNGHLGKSYIDHHAWGTLDEHEKRSSWTLREGDYVLDGEVALDIPPYTISDINALKPRKINAVKRVFNKDGSLHHWEVALV